MLRQVCLAALLAQAGAWVPAESLELTPVDAIFVRMGARDAIMSGQVRRGLSLPGGAQKMKLLSCPCLSMRHVIRARSPSVHHLCRASVLT